MVDPDSGRKTLKVTEWQWKTLSVADGSRKILVEMEDSEGHWMVLKDTECC